MVQAIRDGPLIRSLASVLTLLLVLSLFTAVGTGAVIADHGDSPTITTFSPSDGTAFDASTENVTILVEYEAGAAAINASDVELRVNGEDVSAHDETTITATATEHTLDTEQGETYTVEITVPDKDGNVQTQESTFWLESDTQAPELVSVTPENGSALPAATTDVTVAFEYEDDVSGIDPSSVEFIMNDTDVTSDSATSINESMATHTVAVAPGESHAATVVVADQAGNTAEFATSFTIEAMEPTPANFTVSLEDVPDTVEAGERVTVDAIIENTGEQADEQQITLFVENTTQDVATVALDAGEREHVRLEYETDHDDVPSVTLAIASENDTVTTSVAVDPPAEPPNFMVTILEHDDPVVSGESGEITAEIENTGERSGEQSIKLFMDDARLDEQVLELAAGEKATLTFTFPVSGEAGSESTLTVQSENHSATETVSIIEPAAPATFTIVSVTTNEPVVAGETVQIDAAITNTGDEIGVQSVQLTDPAGNVVDEISLEIAPGTTETAELAWWTTADDVGTTEVTISTANESVTEEIHIKAPPEPATFAVVDLAVEPDQVEPGEAVDVSVTVQNIGGEADEQGVTVELAGEAAEFSTYLAGGETTTEAVTMSAPDTPGSYLVTAITQAHDASATLTVEDPLTSAEFSVAFDEIPESGTVGEELTVTTTITNTGETSGEETIEFRVGDETVERTTVSLDGGESVEQSFTYTPSEDDIPTVTMTLTSATASDTRAISVEAAPKPDLSIVGEAPESVERGESAALNLTANNQGTATAESTLTVWVNDREVWSGDRVLGPGASWQESVALPTTESGVANWTVEFGDASDSGSMLIVEHDQPQFVIRSMEPAAVDAAPGETVEITATIANDGEIAGEGDVILSVLGNVTDTSTVTLAPGEEETVSFIVPVPDEAGIYGFTVQIDSASQTGDITVSGGEETENNRLPGFGVIGGLIALVALVMIGLRRQFS